MIPINLILAADEDNGIGFGNSLPWHFSQELRYFARVTTQTFSEKKINAVIMGRNTWNSLPHKPLKNRVNMVLSSTPLEGVLVFPSLSKAIANCRTRPDLESIFIIGGARLYQDIVEMNLWYKLFLTRVCGSFACDIRLPEIADIETSTLPVKTVQEMNMRDGKMYEYKHYVIDNVK